MRALDKGIQRGQLKYIDGSLGNKSNYCITTTGTKARNKELDGEVRKGFKWPLRKKKQPESYESKSTKKKKKKAQLKTKKKSRRN